MMPYWETDLVGSETPIPDVPGPIRYGNGATQLSPMNRLVHQAFVGYGPGRPEMRLLKATGAVVLANVGLDVSMGTEPMTCDPPRAPGVESVISGWKFEVSYI